MSAKPFFALATCALLVACGGRAHLDAASPQGRTKVAALVAAIGDGTAASDAIPALRSAGPAGAEALRAELAKTTEPTRIERLRAALDGVAKQKDAWASGLYWYTDLHEAEDAARATHRPILSLRLLGNLDDELSCANSRFFRTALYANTTVAQYLRDHFVLHWSSERPAPVLTIDFRDGRKIQRTVTGNSIHFVLDEDGRPVDAIPGLYGPAKFVTLLSSAEGLALSLRGLNDTAREDAITRWHTTALTSLNTEWTGALTRAGITDPQMYALPAPPASGSKAPPAIVAAPIAYAKAAVEVPLVRAALPSMQLPEDRLPWASITAQYAGSAKLDASSRALMRAKNPMDWSNASDPEPLDDAAFEKLVTSFEGLMVEDGTRNEFRAHSKIHAWFVETPSPSFEALDARVYGELFLTPKSDPWLGLVPPNVYSGIANDGIMR
jgi:hypothetical protein